MSIQAQPQWMHCRKCDHLWEGELLVGVSCEQASAFMRLLRCPVCYAGSRKLGIVTDLEQMRAEIAARKGTTP